MLRDIFWVITGLFKLGNMDLEKSECRNVDHGAMCLSGNDWNKSSICCRPRE